MRGLLYYNYDSKVKFARLFIFLLIIIIANITLMTNPIALIISCFQYSLVFFYIIKNDIENAVLWHFTFVMLSLSSTGTLGMFESYDFLMYNYGSLKLIGPVRAFYIMNIIFMIILFEKQPQKSILLYKLYKSLSVIMGMGLIIGLLGCIFNPFYQFSDLISSAVYIFVVLSSLFILLRVATKLFIYASYNIGICTLMVGVIGSFITATILGVTSSYSVYEIPYSADSTFLAPVLIIAILFVKHKFYLCITLVMFLLTKMVALGGKSFFSILFCISSLIYLVFFDRYIKNKLGQRIRFIRITIIVAFLLLISFVIRNVVSDTMTFYKVSSAFSIFSGDLDNMSSSPYVRVASLINIIHEGLLNPFALVFGNGYGGFFRDDLNLFVNIDLTQGAWNNADVSSGYFHTGHDTIVTVPLFNGLIGLYILCKFGVLYIKRIRLNFFNAVAFMWLLLMFYFNTLVAAMSVFLLLAAEYDILQRNNDIKYGENIIH